MMRGGMAALICCALLMNAGDAKPRKEPPPTAPKQAIGDFTSMNYAITFKAPEHAYFCPLPDGWVGSDHGTVLFLAAPRACYGAGYPSLGRGFEPSDVPRIELYYGYDLADSEDRHQPPPCRAAGTARVLGKAAPLCQETKDGLAIITAQGRYVADQPAMLSVTLVVSPADVSRFLPTFKMVLASIHPCRARWEASDEHGKIVKSGYIGHGPACPSGQWY
jgi:hypothetical protein